MARSKNYTTSSRKAYPLDQIKTCGDEWCINGPPGDNVETYFLCKECGKQAPDAIELGYAVAPQKMKRGDREKISASVLCSFLTERNKQKI